MALLIILVALGFVIFSFVITAGESVMFCFLLAIAAIMAAALIYRNYTLHKTISKVSENELHVLNLDKGGVFRLTGVGPNSEEVNLKVLAKHMYRQGDYYWYELECDKGGGEKIWVEIEDDDDTDVSIVLEKLTLSQVGVSPSSLDMYDENEQGHISYKGMSFEYSDSDEATFYRFCDDAKSEKLYYWDFERGKYSLSFERWGNREYEVFYSQKMLPAQITVYLNKERGV